MSQGFIEKLLSGDVRTIIILVLGLLLIYLVYRFFKEMPMPLKEIAHWIKLAAVVLLIYGVFTNPAKVGEMFFTLVDWITGTVSTFIKSDTSQDILGVVGTAASHPWPPSHG